MSWLPSSKMTTPSNPSYPIGGSGQTTVIENPTIITAGATPVVSPYVAAAPFYSGCGAYGCGYPVVPVRTVASPFWGYGGYGYGYRPWRYGYGGRRYW